MSYGKDPNMLKKVGSYRQVTSAYTNKRETTTKKGGGGAVPYYIDQYKPSTDDPDTIRILLGEYPVEEAQPDGSVATILLPFLPHTDHYDGRNDKGCICSAGPFPNDKKKSRPCVGCQIFWATLEARDDGKAGKKSKRMSRSDKFAYSILDYGKFHKMEQIDRRTGQVRRNESTGDAYYNWEKCQGIGCDGCKANKETKQGRTMHWALGWGHHQSLLSADKDIGKSCRTCGGMNCIVGLAWVCRGCGEAVVDMRSTSLKSDDIDKLIGKEHHCSCGTVDFLNEIIHCNGCTDAGRIAERATIFDVDMSVKRVKTVNDQTILQISNWSAPRPVDPNFRDLAKPLDLTKIYAPTPIERQEQLFGQKVQVSGEPQQPARQPVTAGDVARPYGGSVAAPPQLQPVGGPQPLVGTQPVQQPAPGVQPFGVPLLQPPVAAPQPATAPTANPWAGLVLPTHHKP